MTDLARPASNLARFASAWLALAAAPILALMGAIAAIRSPGMEMCTAAFPMAPINDMALMYLVMSVFHLPSWLKFFSAHSHHQTEGD